MRRAALHQHGLERRIGSGHLPMTHPLVFHVEGLVGHRPWRGPRFAKQRARSESSQVQIELNLGAAASSPFARRQHRRRVRLPSTARLANGCGRRPHRSPLDWSLFEIRHLQLHQLICRCAILRNNRPRCTIVPAPVKNAARTGVPSAWPATAYLHRDWLELGRLDG